MVPKMVLLLFAPQTRACEGPDKGRFGREEPRSRLRSDRLYLGQTAAVSACGLTDILSLIADIRLRGRPDIPGLCRDVCQMKAKVFEEITGHYRARQGGRQDRVRPFISRPCQQHFRVSSVMMASQRVLRKFPAIRRYALGLFRNRPHQRSPT
jgi:hypothetical protein